MWSSQGFGLEGQGDGEHEQLLEGRRAKAFDFCFQALYPSPNEAIYR
jgi:hypothetical protein